MVAMWRYLTLLLHGLEPLSKGLWSNLHLLANRIVPSCYSLLPSTPSQGHDHVIVKALDSHPKAVQLTFVYWNLREAYLLKVGLAQIMADHEPLFMSCHVGIHMDFACMIVFWAPRSSLSSVK